MSRSVLTFTAFAAALFAAGAAHTAGPIEVSCAYDLTPAESRAFAASVVLDARPQLDQEDASRRIKTGVARCPSPVPTAPKFANLAEVYSLNRATVDLVDERLQAMGSWPEPTKAIWERLSASQKAKLMASATRNLPLDASDMAELVPQMLAVGAPREAQPLTSAMAGLTAFAKVQDAEATWAVAPPQEVVRVVKSPTKHKKSKGKSSRRTKGSSKAKASSHGKASVHAKPSSKSKAAAQPAAKKKR